MFQGQLFLQQLFLRSKLPGFYSMLPGFISIFLAATADLPYCMYWTLWKQTHQKKKKQYFLWISFFRYCRFSFEFCGSLSDGNVHQMVVSYTTVLELFISWLVTGLTVFFIQPRCWCKMLINNMTGISFVNLTCSFFPLGHVKENTKTCASCTLAPHQFQNFRFIRVVYYAH